MRASTRSRLRWRMISWPAEKPMRCVKPSIATVSPSRTRSATASRIEAVLSGIDGRLSRRRLPRPIEAGARTSASDLLDVRRSDARHVGDGLPEDVDGRLRLGR